MEGGGKGGRMPRRQVEKKADRVTGFQTRGFLAVRPVVHTYAGKTTGRQGCRLGLHPARTPHFERTLLLLEHTP